MLFLTVGACLCVRLCMRQRRGFINIRVSEAMVSCAAAAEQCIDTAMECALTGSFERCSISVRTAIACVDDAVAMFDAEAANVQTVRCAYYRGVRTLVCAFSIHCEPRRRWRGGALAHMA